MPKSQHSKDRMFLTQTEWKRLGGGGQNKALAIQKQYAKSQRLSFDTCALSFTRHSNPACTRDCGIPIDILELVPFLRKYNVHPITGKPISRNEIANTIVPMTFHKNREGKFHCPITFNVFSKQSHIVVVAPSSSRNNNQKKKAKIPNHVYSMEAIKKLCLKTKNEDHVHVSVPSPPSPWT